MYNKLNDSYVPINTSKCKELLGYITVRVLLTDGNIWNIIVHVLIVGIGEKYGERKQN